MTKTKNAKRSLFRSAFVLMVCMAMFVGTTFAWFTDSVTSGSNVIESGNLDVVLEYKAAWEDEWKPVDENTKIFKEGALYEPGYTEVAYLRVSNAGNLALKYDLKVNIKDETTSTNVGGEEFKLSDYLKIGSYVMDEYNGEHNYANTLMPFMFGTREAALQNIGSLTKIADCEVKDAPVLPGDKTAQVVALVLTMPKTVDNDANHKTGVNAPTIDLGINLVATQLAEESDSFGTEYDKNATYKE